MYKLFSPKDYTFLGIIFGVPTALYASIRNGLSVKDKHPEILRQTKVFAGIFIAIFLISVIADIANAHYTANSVKTFLGAQTPTNLILPGRSTVDSAEQLIRAYANRTTMINWAFILAQLVLLFVFVKKAKLLELPIYETLKQQGQATHRSNVELVAVGLGVWALFWLYGQLINNLMMSWVGLPGMMM